jgi:hypothetical protein
MLKFILALAAMFSFSQIEAQKTVIQDANAQVRNVGPFSEVKISGGIDLYLTQGNEDGVAVSANDNQDRDRIKTSVDNGMLKIWYDSEGLRFKSGNKNMKAYVSFRSINGLIASGACDVRINGTLKGDGLNMKLSGASDFEGTVQLDKLKIDQSGASDTKISGSVGSLNVQASGASDLKGYELQVNECTAKASGASDIQITVNKELSAQASGASSISYKGGGVVKEVHTSGASSINKRG